MDHIKIYEFFKVDFSQEDYKNKIGDCPFCLDEHHFSVNKATGQFRCFKCEASGNVYSFFHQLVNTFLELTPKSKYRELARERGISSTTLAQAKFAYDPNHDRWLVPFYNGSENPSNLGVFYPFSNAPYRILKAPSLPLKLYRPFDTKSLGDDVWAFEGEWDLLAARDALSRAKIKGPSLVSTSGATTWTEDMNKAAKGKNVVFFWDNDKAGKELGPKSIQKRISGVTYSFIQWPEESQMEETFGVTEKPIKDVRDLVLTAKERGLSKSDVGKELMDLSLTTTVFEAEEIVELPHDTQIDDIQEIKTYQEFSELLTQDIYLNDSMRRSWEICMAAALSVHLPDNPLWVFLIGPASTGKTTLIDSFGGASEWFDYVSKMTSESLVSGWQGQQDYLPSLDGKTLFIGDMTVILSLPLGVQEKLWGLLREAYGGIYVARYGNQEPKKFTGFKFCMVAGVTHAIYAFNDSDMGERFIKVDYIGRDFDEDAHMEAAMKTQGRFKHEIKPALKAATLGYFKHLKTSTDFTTPIEVEFGTEVDTKIKALAKLTTRLRTKVQKDRFEGMISRPVSESPARFATQLTTLAKCLAWVTQSDTITPYIYESLQKVAFDSCPGLGLEVVLFIHKHKTATVSSLVNNLSIPKTRVQQITNDFLSLGILSQTKKNNGTGRRGRNLRELTLTPPIITALDGVALKETPKRSFRPSQSRFKRTPSKPSKRIQKVLSRLPQRKPLNGKAG